MVDTMTGKQIVDKYLIERHFKEGLRNLQLAEIFFEDNANDAKTMVRKAIKDLDALENLLIEYGADND
jgi:hypothetical protein